MKSLSLRKSRWVDFGMVATITLLMIGVLSEHFLKAAGTRNNISGFSIFLTVILGVGLIYYLKELILNKPEIILTEEGIELKDHGWNHWEYVNSINVVIEKDNENGSREYLIIHLKDSSEMRCEISDLRKRPGEILSLVREFKNNALISEN